MLQPLTDDKQAAWKALVEAVAPSQERSAFTVRWSLQDSTGKILCTHGMLLVVWYRTGKPTSFSWLGRALYRCRPS